VKSTKPQAKDKERRETKHIHKCLPNSIQINLIWGDIDLSNPLSINSLLRDIKEL